MRPLAVEEVVLALWATLLVIGKPWLAVRFWDFSPLPGGSQSTAEASVRGPKHVTFSTRRKGTGSAKSPVK